MNDTLTHIHRCKVMLNTKHMIQRSTFALKIQLCHITIVLNAVKSCLEGLVLILKWNKPNQCSSKISKLFPLPTEPHWRAAVGQFEGALGPAENRIAGKLKKQCQNKNGNTLQFLQEFKRYKELIRRPSIQKSLVMQFPRFIRSSSVELKIIL